MLGVSIIIVNYNMARYVGAAIDSALAQTHPVLEVIAVDDGSTDDSSNVISSYADRVRIVLFEENRGQVAALCRAWPLARHPVIVFLDSDDLLLPHAAARLAATFAATMARVQFCLQTIDDAGRPLDHVAPKYPSHLDTKTIRSELLRTGSSPAAQGSGNAYAKWMLEKVERDNGFEMPAEKRMAMDAAMEVNAAFYGEVLTLREPLGCYRIHASNVTGHLTVSHRRFIRTIDKFDFEARLPAAALPGVGHRLRPRRGAPASASGFRVQAGGRQARPAERPRRRAARSILAGAARLRHLHVQPAAKASPRRLDRRRGGAAQADGDAPH